MSSTIPLWSSVWQIRDEKLVEKSARKLKTSRTFPNYSLHIHKSQISNQRYFLWTTMARFSKAFTAYVPRPFPRSVSATAMPEKQPRKADSNDGSHPHETVSHRKSSHCAHETIFSTDDSPRPRASTPSTRPRSDATASSRASWQLRCPCPAGTRTHRRSSSYHSRSPACAARASAAQQLQPSAGGSQCHGSLTSAVGMAMSTPGTAGAAKTSLMGSLGRNARLGSCMRQSVAQDRDFCR